MMLSLLINVSICALFMLLGIFTMSWWDIRQWPNPIEPSLLRHYGLSQRYWYGVIKMTALYLSKLLLLTLLMLQYPGTNTHCCTVVIFSATFWKKTCWSSSSNIWNRNLDNTYVFSYFRLSTYCLRISAVKHLFVSESSGQFIFIPSLTLLSCNMWMVVRACG